MRNTLKVLISIIVVVLIAEGIYLAYLIQDTDKIIKTRMPQLDAQGKEVLSNITSFRNEEQRIRDRYPVSEPKSWLNLINTALSSSGVQIQRVQKDEATDIKGSEARRVQFSIEIRSEDKTLIVNAASAVERIDPAVIVSSFTLPPRRAETAPYVCTMEVTIYEKISVGEEAQPEAETPQPSPAVTIPAISEEPIPAEL